MKNDTLLSPEADAGHALLAARLAALSHPTRLAILRQLAGAECCCCKDVVGTLDLAQSTVSQHLKVLVGAGLVQLTPERQRSMYRVDRAALAGLARSLDCLLSACCAAPEGGAPATTEKS